MWVQLSDAAQVVQVRMTDLRIAARAVQGRIDTKPSIDMALDEALRAKRADMWRLMYAERGQ